MHINIIEPVLEEINRRQQRRLEYAFRVNRMFTQMILRGATIDSLVRTLARELKCPVLVVNDNYVNLSAFEPRELSVEIPDAIRNYMSDHMDGDLKQILERIRRFREPTRHYIRGFGQPGSVGCIAMPIAIDDVCKGFLVSFEVDGEIGEAGLAAIDQACLGLSLVMMKEKAVRETELRLQGDLLDEVLSGSLGSDEAIIQRAASLGLRIASKRLAIVMIGGGPSQRANGEANPATGDP